MGNKRRQESIKTSIMDSFMGSADKYSHQLLLFSVLFLALLLRVLALLSLKGSVYYDFLLWDERLYHTWAANLAKGTFESSSVYEMAPLPAYFMALIYRLFSPDVIYIRISNIIFGVLTCFFIYLIGRELVNKKTGLFACLIASLYKPFIFYSIVPLKTSLSVFLFASACYLLVAFINNMSLLKALLLGIVIALANNVRPNCLVLIPIIFLLLAWNAYKERSSFERMALTLVLYVAGLAIVQSPFLIRNYMVAGESSATPSQSGFNLFICNNMKYGYPVYFASTSPSQMGIHFTIEASKRVGKKLSSREASHYWTNEVIKTAMEQPLAFAWRQLRKSLNFFNWFEKGDHYHIGFISNHVKFFKLPLLCFWLILPFGMAGMVLRIFRSRKDFALGSIFIVYGLTLVLFFTNIRVRLPLLTILIPFTVAGLNDLYLFLYSKQTKKIMAYASVLIAFFIIEFLPVRDAKDMTAYLNTHAIILQSKGLEGEAVRYWEKSSRMEKHYSAFADIALAGRYLSGGDIQKAQFYLNRIGDDSYAASTKYDMIGDIMVRRGHFDEAVNAYEKALHINSGLRNIHAKLIKVLWRIDKQKALEESDRLEYINSFYTLYGQRKE